MKKLFLLLCLLGGALYLVSSLAAPGAQHATPARAASSQRSSADLVTGAPSVSASFINDLLCRYHSPACGDGQALYSDGKLYGIDPAYALAFFWHESQFGTTGEARVTLSLGNERCIPDRPCIDLARGGYAKMNSWDDGFKHWYKLIRLYINGEINRYIGRSACPCLTIRQIIPVYAPSSDHNDEKAYIAAILASVTKWRSEQ